MLFKPRSWAHVRTEMLSVGCVACREAERPLPQAAVLVGVLSPLGQLCSWYLGHHGGPESRGTPVPRP